MFLRVLPLALLVLLVATPTGPAARQPPFPEGVLVLPYDQDEVVVAWTRDAANASYLVYGEARTGALTFLAETTGTTVIATAGFSAYTVNTVVDGQVVSTRRGTPVCVEIYDFPPRVAIVECGAYKLPVMLAPGVLP